MSSSAFTIDSVSKLENSESNSKLRLFKQNKMFKVIEIRINDPK